MIIAGRKKFKKSSLLIGVLAGIITFIIPFFILHQQQDIKLSKTRAKLSAKCDDLNRSFNYFFNNLYSSLASLTPVIDAKGNIINFPKKAAEVIKDNPSISIVSALPDGIVKYTYPMNEDGINHNVFSSSNPEKRAGALEMLHSKQIRLGGPFKNLITDSCIVARMPIYINEKFWGFLAVVVKLNDMVKAINIPLIDSEQYSYHLAYITLTNKKEVLFFNRKSDIKKTNYIAELIPDINWKLYISHKKTTIPILPIILYFLLSIFVGLYVKKFIERSFSLQSIIYENKKRIADSEQQFKAIFENAPLGIAIVSDNNIIQIANNTFWKLFDYKNHKESPSDIAISALLPNNIYNIAINELTISNPEKKLEVVKTYKLVAENGFYTWGQTKIFPLNKDDQGSRKYVVLIEDITDKVLAEEKTEVSNKKYRLLFDESPIALWEEDFSEVVEILKTKKLLGKPEEEVLKYFDEHPQEQWYCLSKVKIESLNDECVRQYGLKNKNELLQNFTQLIPTERSAYVIKKMLAAICRGQHKFKSESTFYNSNKELRNSILSWQVIPGHEQDYKQVILTTVDITDLKKSKIQLETTTARLQSLIDNIDGLVWQADPASLRFSFVSRKITELTGYEVDDWLGKSILNIERIYQDSQNKIQEILEECIEKTNYCELEYGARTKNGSIKWYKESIDFIKDNNGKLINIIGIVVDITDIYTSKLELKDSIEILHQKNKQLMDFSYVVSHNLRSHTSNIESLCDLILSSQSTTEKEELLKSLADVAKILNLTMEDLNDIVRIHSDVTVKRDFVNIKDEVNTTIQILSNKIKDKKAVILNNIPSNTIIYYNKVYIESILLNLISNSLKYAKPNLIPTINVSYSEEHNVKALTVSDNGIGIDLDKNGRKLFGLFKTFSPNPESKGVGLYITKRQVEAMGGNIMVESKLNVGTSFKITFK